MPPETSLTEAVIRAIFEQERCRAAALFSHWEHPFTSLSFNRARRAYGHAHADGRIVISNTFIDTSAVADLRDTIRHELAHLIAGLRFKHGPPWQQVAQSLGARPHARGRSQCSTLHEKMNDAPFTLIAVMRDGEQRTLRKVFRRARRFVDYRYGKQGQRYHIRGEFIERFEYLDHRE